MVKKTEEQEGESGWQKRKKRREHLRGRWGEVHEGAQQGGILTMATMSEL